MADASQEDAEKPIEEIETETIENKSEFNKPQKTSVFSSLNFFGLNLLDVISLVILTFSALTIFALKLPTEGWAIAIGGFFGAFLSCIFVWLVLVVASIPLKYLSLRPSKSLLFFLAAIMAFIVYISMSYLKYENTQALSLFNRSSITQEALL